MLLATSEILRIAVLVELSDAPDHGYALHERLKESGVRDAAHANTGGLYRVLRVMSEDKLLESTWDTPTAGPARRVYAITPDGQQWLAERRQELHDDITVIRQLLAQMPRSV